MTADGELLLQVENRFDFTDLKDCRFEWEVAGQTGRSDVSVVPHNSGILRIGPLKGDLNGKVLSLRIYSPFNLLIDESSIDIGEVSHEDFPFRLAEGTVIKEE